MRKVAASMVIGLMLVSTGCASQPGGLTFSPSAATSDPAPTNAIEPNPATVSQRPSPTTPTAEPSVADLQLAELVWYEVERIGDLAGNQNRTLIYGSLDGEVRGRLPLASQTPDQRQGGAEPFRWIDPQAAGIFDGRALVWGRDGQLNSLETVDLQSGAIETLVEAEQAIHVATADPRLSRAYFVTVDEASGRPIALMMLDAAGDSGLAELDYEFAPEQVSNRFMYRLATNEDGSLLAIQPDDGSVTVIDVTTGDGSELIPGGPIVGFADESLVSLTAEGPSGQRSVVVFDSVTLNGEVVAEQVDAAQTVAGSNGDLIGIMRVDRDNPAAFEIAAIDLRTRESTTVYVHDEPAAGPFMPREDRSFVEVETPQDWVALIESFRPFIASGGVPAKDVPESQRPRLLNLRTGDSQVVGPFSE